MYCVKCGNTGIDIDGEPCSCRFNAKSFFDAVSCLDIPQQYQGVQFNKALVPKDMDESYANFLQSVYDTVFAGKWLHRNVVIASPIMHSKTILAYSCIEVMFRANIPTFPVYDVLELYRMLVDMDLGKKSIYDIENPVLIVDVPLLFVKIPRNTSWAVYDGIAMILDRRVRRGNSTIFIYDGSWSLLVANDNNGILTGLMGDGNFGSLEVRNFHSNKTESEVQFKDNIG